MVYISGMKTINRGTEENPVWMDVYDEDPVTVAPSHSIIDDVKGAAKSVLTLPGKIVAANLRPVQKEVGATLTSVTAPLMPILILALIGGYIYFNSKKVGVYVQR
jgi:hypothetical protein